MTGSPIDVVGTAIASLVAVDALASAGHNVRWIRPPGPLNGGFQPLQRDGRRLELGMRLIELSYDEAGAPSHQNTEPPLAEYRPGPHGHRPYLGTVERFIRALAGDGLRPVEAPSCWVRGTIGADYVVVGDLSDLPRFVDAPTLRRIAAETAAAVADAGPRGLHGRSPDDPRWDEPLTEIGPAQTGATFWRSLIQPLLDAIVEPCDIPVSRHRKVWMPLFHPATLHDAATGRLTYCPDRPLYTLAEGGMNLILERLEARALASGTVTVVPVGPITGVRAAGTQVVFTDASGHEIATISPIVGVEPRQLFGAAGIAFEPERGMSTLAWVDVDPREAEREVLPSVEWVIDDRLPAYRIARNRAEPPDPQRCSWIVELRHDLDGDPEIEAVRTIRQLGLGGSSTSAITSVRVPSFAVPDRVNEERFVTARRAFDQLDLDLHLVGGAVAFTVDSLNEQIVQGLRAARAAATENSVASSAAAA